MQLLWRIYSYKGKEGKPQRIYEAKLREERGEKEKEGREGGREGGRERERGRGREGGGGGELEGGREGGREEEREEGREGRMKGGMEGEKIRYRRHLTNQLCIVLHQSVALLPVLKHCQRSLCLQLGRGGTQLVQLPLVFCTLQNDSWYIIPQDDVMIILLSPTSTSVIYVIPSGNYILKNLNARFLPTLGAYSQR